MSELNVRCRRAGGTGVETLGSLPKIASAHDIPSLACHLHRDTLRNPGADETADGRPAEVAQESPGTSSFSQAVRKAARKLLIGYQELTP